MLDKSRWCVISRMLPRSSSQWLLFLYLNAFQDLPVDSITFGVFVSKKIPFPFLESHSCKDLFSLKRWMNEVFLQPSACGSHSSSSKRKWILFAVVESKQIRPQGANGSHFILGVKLQTFVKVTQYKASRSSKASGHLIRSIGSSDDMWNLMISLNNIVPDCVQNKNCETIAILYTFNKYQKR